MWNCVQLRPSPDFADPLMERTGVVVSGRFKRFRDICPGFAPYPDADAVRQRFLAHGQAARRWFDDNPHISPHPGFPDDPDQAIAFWQAEPRIDSATIVTVSRDGEWRIATSSPQADLVWTNPGISCHHADATVPSCPPGQTAQVTTRVNFSRREAQE